MLGLVIAVMITPVSDLVLDGLQRSHERATIGSFTARLLQDNFGETRNRYEIAYRWPNEFRIKTFYEDTSELVRDTAIEPSRIVNYDPSLQQYTVEVRGPDADILNDVLKLEQGLSDVVVMFVHKSGSGSWLEKLRTKSPWKTTANSNRVRLSYEGDGEKIEIDIDKRSFLLTRIDSTTRLQRQEWRLDYDTKPKSTRFTPPGGSYQVPFFDRDIQQPTYADSRAREVTEKLFAAYSDLTSIGYKVQRSEGETTVRLYKRFVSQDGPIAEWTFDGRTLVFHHKPSDEWYRGSATFSQVIDIVGNLGTRVDPTVNLLMRGINPYRHRLGDGAHIRVMGDWVTEDGDTVTMLGAETDNADITLYVRDSDGLVLSTITRVKGGGASGFQIELKFDYFEVSANVKEEQKLVAPVGTSFTPVQQLLTPSD